MLNRRFLRIKALQAVFAYQVKKEANVFRSNDFIEESFAPDLTAAKRPDYEGLTKSTQKGGSPSPPHAHATHTYGRPRPYTHIRPLAAAGRRPASLSSRRPAAQRLVSLSLPAGRPGPRGRLPATRIGSES